MSVLQGSLRGIAATDDPLFIGLQNPKITAIPATAEAQRYLTSTMPPAARPGRWVEQPRLPVPVGEMGVVACNGKIHVVAGYARGRVDNDYHQVFDPAAGIWSFMAPPSRCPATTSRWCRSATSSTPSAASSSRTAARFRNASSTTRPPTNGTRSPG